MNPLGDLTVVGLGNPGRRYENTRHNVGAQAVSVLAARMGARLRRDVNVSAEVATARMGEVRLRLAVPLTFMNDSGRAVAALVRRHDIADLTRLVVVHDELDLSLGTVKVKFGGGLAGHNGLRSVSEHLHSRDYARIRIGVDKPPGGSDRGADWVLTKVSGEARAALESAACLAADAVESIAELGVDAAMQRHNAAP